jgi:hypothetical protein
MTSTKILRRLLLTVVLGAGALTSVAWGETDAPRIVSVRNEWRENRREEARERRARELRRAREQRREREWREHHWRRYDWR